MASTKAANQGMLALLIFAFVLNTFVSGSMIFFLGMIRAVQIILHIPLLQINTPAIVTVIFELIIPIAMFDIFELFEEYDFFNNAMNLLLGQIDGEEVELYEAAWTNGVNIGYQNQNSFSVLGSIAFITTFVYLKILFLTLVKMFSRCCKDNKTLAKMKRKVRFDEMNAVILEGYIEFLITGVINM